MRTLFSNSNKKLGFLLASLMLMMLFSACEDQFLVRLDRPDTEQKVVAFCVIEEGQTEIKCMLTKSNAIFGESPGYRGSIDFDPVRDAEVTISGNGETYTFSYDSQEKLYKVSVAPSFLKGGSSYSLLIESASEGVLSSTTSIPTIAVNDLSMGLDSIFVDNGYWRYEEYLPKFQFTDDAGEGDVYNLQAYGYYDTINQYSTYVSIETPYLVDTENDGAMLERIGRAYKYETYDYLKFDVILQKVTKDHMLYHQSVSGNANYYGDDPFSEPVISYTNIEGGLGLFSGVAKQRYNFLFN